MSTGFRYALLTICGLTLACDATITAIDPGDPDMMARLARVSAGNVTPAEGVLLGLLQRSGAEDTEVPELPQLDSLFTLVTVDGTGDGSADAARQHEQMVRDAWRKLDADSVEAGEESLEQARDFQSSFIADRLGRVGALAYLAVIGRSLEASRERTGPGASRRRRAAIDSAFDLHDDARSAIDEGRVADAFDIASHAAGLANEIAANSVRN